MLGQVELTKRIDNQKLLRHRIAELGMSIANLFPACRAESLLSTLNAFFKDDNSDQYIYYIDDVTVDVIESIGLFEGVLNDLAGDINSSKHKEMVLEIIGHNLNYHYLTSDSNGAPFDELFAFSITVFTLNNWEEMGGTRINEDVISTLIEFASKQKHVLYEKKKILVRSDSYGFINTDSWDKEKNSYSSNLLSSLGIFSEEKDLFVFTKLISNSIIEMLVGEADASGENNYRRDREQSSHQKGMEYEDECIGLFIENGWTALNTPKSGDAGADIIATKRGLKLAVQCKNWSDKVGTTAIQETISAKGYYDADFAVLLTESNITRQAEVIAEKLKVIVIKRSDIPELEVLIIKEGLKGRKRVQTY